MRAPVVLAALLFCSPALAADNKSSGKPALPPGVVQMTAEQQKTVGLKTAQAKRESITEPVRLPGLVAFDPGHYAVVRPFDQARVVRLLVQPGDVVAAQQSVAELEMPGLADLQQSLAAARASAHEAETGVAVATASLDRATILARDGSLARAEADRRRLVRAQAVAVEQTARARVKNLETQVARLDPISGPGGSAGSAALRSPLAGTVVSVGITPGEVIGTTTAAVTVADLHTVMIIAQIPESEATKISVGDPAQLSVTGNSNRSWTGHVATLGAQLDPQARTLPARIEIANPDGTLRAGMYVDVTLTRSLDRESVVVPSAATQLIADKSYVFTPAEGDRFRGRAVQIGVQRQDTVEIRGGLRAGETVVTDGSFQLKALLQQSMLDGK